MQVLVESVSSLRKRGRKRGHLVRSPDALSPLNPVGAVGAGTAGRVRCLSCPVCLSVFAKRGHFERALGRSKHERLGKES